MTSHRLTMQAPRRGTHIKFPVHLHGPAVHQYFFEAVALVAGEMGCGMMMGEVIMEVACYGVGVTVPAEQSLYWPFKIVERAYNSTLAWLDTQPELKAASESINTKRHLALH